MPPCPVHDYDADLQALLGHVTDPTALDRFALEIVARVVDRAGDPVRARRWLVQASRKKNVGRIQEQAEEAADISWAKHIAVGEESAAGLDELRNKALDTKLPAWVDRAITNAISAQGETDLAEKVTCVRATTSCAENAAEIEGVWQLERARVLFCTCPKMPEAAPDESRLRRSLLSD